MLIPVVTAADAAYFPGVVALYNSFKRNAGPGFEFYAILYGEDIQAEGRALGINVITPPDWKARFPTSSYWPEPSAPMYARLLVPRLFKDRPRAIWLDADCVIEQPLQELATLKFPNAMAGVYFASENYTLGFHISDITQNLRDVRVPFTGLMVFNTAEWNRQQITERCVGAMNADAYDYKFAVQSVLGLVLMGNFHRLPYCWQVFAGRKGPLPDDAKILHWVGGLPWKQKMEHQAEWQKYAATA